MTSAPTKRIGEANKHLLLGELRRRGLASVDELVRYTRRSQPTVQKWLAALETEGYLLRSGVGASTGGRPPTLFRFNAQREYLVGLAVEIPAASAVLIDLAGQIVARDHWQMSLAAPAEALLEELASRVKHFVTEAGIRRADVAGCGSAFSGFLNREAGLLVATPRVRNWRNLPVREALSESLAVAVELNHHIDALALAELSCGVAKQWESFVFFDLGYGLGVRLVKGRKPVSGEFGNAGLIGHTTVVPGGRRCICGNAGCLEEYVSLRALMGRVGDGLQSPHAVGAHEDPEQSVVRLLAGDGLDSGSQRSINAEVLKFLSLGIANAVNIFDLPRVVISGFAGRMDSSWRDRLAQAVQERLQAPLAQALDIAYATLPRQLAGARGAALFALGERLPSAHPLVVEPPPLEGGDEARRAYLSEQIAVR